MTYQFNQDEMEKIRDLIRVLESACDHRDEVVRFEDRSDELEVLRLTQDVSRIIR